MGASRRGLGSKREKSPGVWLIRVSKGYRADGRQRVVSRTVRGTEQDAEAEIVKLAREMGRNPTLGDPLTLTAYFYAYFLPLRQSTTTRANWKTHESNYRNHIQPTFGDWDLNDIGNAEIQQWINGLPPQSAPNYVRTLRAVLSQACFDHKVERSPMDGYHFRLPRGRDTSPLPVWGAREVAAALGSEGFRRSRVFAMWCVMCGGGLSRSEALALDWEDVSWSRATGMDGSEHWHAMVSVSKACTARDGMKEPKNSRRYRTVPIAPAFADALREVAGAGPICRSAKGGRMTPCYVSDRWRDLFRHGGALEGMPFVQMNRMRATYATLAQASGIDSTLINAMQGRAANSQVLYANYLNPQNDAFDEAADRISRRVSGGM